jgi:hypothetical protein
MHTACSHARCGGDHVSVCREQYRRSHSGEVAAHIPSAAPTSCSETTRRRGQRGMDDDKLAGGEHVHHGADQGQHPVAASL